MRTLYGSRAVCIGVRVIQIQEVDCNRESKMAAAEQFVDTPDVEEVFSFYCRVYIVQSNRWLVLQNFKN